MTDQFPCRLLPLIFPLGLLSYPSLSSPTRYLVTKTAMSTAHLEVKSALGPQADAKKVRRNPPLPAGSRPKKNPNPFPVLNVIKVPLRVLKPPKVTGMVGSVRSLRSTPMSVTLGRYRQQAPLAPLAQGL